MGRKRNTEQLVMRAAEIARRLPGFRKAKKEHRRRQMIQEDLMAAAEAIRSTSCFVGHIVVHPRELAILEATSMAHWSDSHLAYFTDGSAYPVAGSGGTLVDVDEPTRSFRLAAAVAYKPSQASAWENVAFSVPEVSSRHVEHAEIGGVAGALALALRDTTTKQHANPTLTVTIFTDCQAAISRLRESQSGGPIDSFYSDSLALRSRLLQRLGVLLVIRWVPGHVGVPGNEAADAAAKRMALSNCQISEWEAVQARPWQSKELCCHDRALEDTGDERNLDGTQSLPRQLNHKSKHSGFRLYIGDKWINMFSPFWEP